MLDHCRIFIFHHLLSSDTFFVCFIYLWDNHEYLLILTILSFRKSSVDRTYTKLYQQHKYWCHVDRTVFLEGMKNKPICQYIVDAYKNIINFLKDVLDMVLFVITYKLFMIIRDLPFFWASIVIFYFINQNKMIWINSIRFLTLFETKV